MPGFPKPEAPTKTSVIDLNKSYHYVATWRTGGLHNYRPRDLQAAVGFLREHHGRFPFAELVGPTFALADVEAAFAAAERGEAPRVAVRMG